MTRSRLRRARPIVHKLPIGWWVRGSGWQPSRRVLFVTLGRLAERGRQARTYMEDLK